MSLAHYDWQNPFYFADGVRLWVDSTGVIRFKKGVVTSDTNGTPLFLADGSVAMEGDLDLDGHSIVNIDDLDVDGDADIAGALTVDTIDEHTADAGVTIEGVLLKDGDIDLDGHVVLNPLGIGGSDGKTIVFADQYAGGDMGAKINAAIDDLAGLGGGTVIVPEGNHTITTPIAPANALSYVQVVGAAAYGTVCGADGLATYPTILTQGATNTQVISLVNKGAIGFEGLGLYGVNNASHALVRGYNSASVNFRNCLIYPGYNAQSAVVLDVGYSWLFENCYIGRYSSAAGAVAVVFDDSRVIHMVNCHGKCNGHNVRIMGSNGSFGYDFLFERCTWHAGDYSANNYDAYYIDNTGQCDKIRIVDCWQEEASDTRYGINIQNASPGFIGIYGGKMAGATGPWNDRTRISAIVGVEI